MTYSSTEPCYSVIPANAGIHNDFGMSIFKWTPVCAGRRLNHA
jgi:hypothetical protein